MLIILIFLIFLLNPVFGIICGLVFAWRNKQSSGFLLLSLQGAAYLGLINTTKVPDSDLINYIEWYLLAEGRSLVEYLSLFQKEPIYFTWAYLVYYFSCGSYTFFIFLTTFVCYIVLAFNIYKICTFLMLAKRDILLLLLGGGFFFPLFSLSAHVIRQFLAGALLLTFYAEWVVSGRRPWWFLIFASLTHLSSVVFLFLATINLGSRVDLGQFFARITILLISVALLIGAFSGFFISIPLYGLVFSRIYINEWHNIGSISGVAQLFAVLVAVGSIKNLALEKSPNNYSLRNLNLTVVLLVLFVIISNFYGNKSELVTRFYFYLYFLAALTFPALLSVLFIPRYFLVFVVVLSALHFFINIEAGVWRYANLLDILLAPSWSLWGG